MLVVCWLLDCCLLLVGCWLFDVCSRLLVGCWLLVVLVLIVSTVMEMTCGQCAVYFTSALEQIFRSRFKRGGLILA